MTEERRKAWAERKRERRKGASNSSERRPTPDESNGGLKDAPLRSAFAECVELRAEGAFPKGSSVSVKRIAYMHELNKMNATSIIAACGGKLTYAQLHAALAYYYLHRDAVDALIRRDRELNSADVLATTGRLPRASLFDLAGADEFPS